VSRYDPPERLGEPLFLVPWPVPAFAFSFVVIHAVLQFGPFELKEFAYLNFPLVPVRFLDTEHLLSALPTLVTYAFLHYDWFHVLVNVVLLLAAAGPVMRNCGVLRMWLLFLACSAGGALLHLAIFWGQPESVIGASGGAAGIIAAALRYRTRRLSQGEIVAPITRPPGWIFTLFWIGINLMFFIWDQIGGGAVSGYATMAHIGGYLAGLFLAPVFVRGARPAPWPRRS
jgi:membrane associated rhomboid family serine protease